MRILIIGLGNPGNKYARSRHNAGYLAIDAFKKASLPPNLILKKTNVFMNNSGPAVKFLATRYQLPTANIYIIHDDLDLKLGEYKIQRGIGPKDHNGLLSVEKALNTADFWRIRLGVDARDPDNRLPGEEYVLQDFTPEELIIFQKMLKKLSTDLKKFLSNLKISH